MAQQLEALRAVDAPPNAIWLDSLDFSKMVQRRQTPWARRTLGAGRGAQDAPITLGDITYPHGIGTLSINELIVDLKGQATRFVAMVGMDDAARAGRARSSSKSGSTTRTGSPATSRARRPAGAGGHRSDRRPLHGAFIDDGGDASTGGYADWGGGLIYLKPDATAAPDSWTFPATADTSAPLGSPIGAWHNSKMKRSGVADLPLHGGRVPPWLATRMTVLGTAICESMVQHYGRSALLSRLSDPFWFQALGCVMGMDWHSSGITTSVLGALKRGLNPRSRELGLYVCGGRGRHSRNTPAELTAVAERTGLDGDALVRTSRLTARVDNNAIADGFQIYLHGFLVTADGEWVVVQQGLNDATGLARRYHWHSATVRDFTCEPHSAIVGEHVGVIQNLVDERARPAQNALLDIVTHDPAHTLATARTLIAPTHHDVRPKDVNLERLGAVLAVAHERPLQDFASLLLVENLGPRTLQSLALVAEVVHGTPTRFSDPARFSFAHGGKDGHPFPVPLKTYDETIAVLRRSLECARVDHSEKSGGLKRLNDFVQRVERQFAPEADFDAVLRHERAISRSLDGRTVFDDAPRQKRRGSRQLSLFDK